MLPALNVSTQFDDFCFRSNLYKNSFSNNIIQWWNYWPVHFFQDNVSFAWITCTTVRYWSNNNNVVEFQTVQTRFILYFFLSLSKIKFFFSPKCQRTFHPHYHSFSLWLCVLVEEKILWKNQNKQTPIIRALQEVFFFANFSQCAACTCSVFTFDVIR